MNDYKLEKVWKVGKAEFFNSYNDALKRSVELRKTNIKNEIAKLLSSLVLCYEDEAYKDRDAFVLRCKDDYYKGCDAFIGALFDQYDIKLKNDGRTPNRAGPNTVKPAILELIKRNKNGLTSAEIIATTGFKASSVRGTLSALHTAGDITRIEDHFFLRARDIG